MIQVPQGFDSIFRYIVVVSQRAEQLVEGAKVRCETRHKKPTLAAKDDVDAGLVDWRVLSQEELDAQRQAIVDQFRAEVGAEEAEAAPSIPDVLPTETAAPDAAPEPAPEVEERDDEINRLQRLLGLAGASISGDAVIATDPPVPDDDEAEASSDASAEDPLEDPLEETPTEVALDVVLEQEEEAAAKDDDEDE